MNKNVCQSCGSNSARWTEKFPGTHLETCSNCGSFSYFGEIKETAEELYSRDYFETDEYINYEAHSNVHQLNFRRKFRILEKLGAKPLNIFEVGCAYGFFLEQAKLMGASNVFGVDVNPKVVERAQARAGKGNAGQVGAPIPPGANCIVAWDVWEHLPAPFNLFSGYAQAMKKGDLLAVSTVDSSAAVARSRGKKWRQIHPPTHLHYPTRKGLDKAFDSMGLDVIHHRPFGYYRALQTYTAALGVSIPNSSRLATIPVYLNLYDVQLVVGRKR